MNKLYAAVLVAAPLFSAPALYGATILDSNGTGGGNWSSGSTWSNTNTPASTAPTDDNFQIQPGDSVTATAVTLAGSATTTYYANILGTLTIGAGSAFTGIYNFDNTATGPGTLNINGGSLTSRFFQPPSSATLTVNITNGSMTVTNSGGASFAIVNVYAGGTYNNASYSTSQTINLLGGTLYVPTVQLASWALGTLVTNTQSLSSTYSGNYSTELSANAGNVLSLSNQSTPQTTTWTSASNFHPTAGTIQINVYSAGANDSMTSTSGSFSIGSNVGLDLDSHGNLPGTPSSYETTYQLFNEPSGGSYAGLLPTLAPAVWEIGGTEYDVTFANTISSNGQVTVTNLSPVPEPAALGLLGASTLLALRRRRGGFVDLCLPPRYKCLG